MYQAPAFTLPLCQELCSTSTRTLLLTPSLVQLFGPLPTKWKSYRLLVECGIDVDALDGTGDGLRSRMVSLLVYTYFTLLILPNITSQLPQRRIEAKMT